MPKESRDFKISRPKRPEPTEAEAETEALLRDAISASKYRGPSAWRDELKKIERPKVEPEKKPFTGITAAECNAWLATLPPVPLYGEDE